MFSRWSQENFFRYMMQHFAIDLLNEYGRRRFLRPNGPWSTPSGGNWTVGNVGQVQADPSASPLRRPDIASGSRRAQVKWEKRKAELVEEIQQFEKELADINIS